MSDTRPANFSSVWADLSGVSFKQSTPPGSGPAASNPAGPMVAVNPGDAFTNSNYVFWTEGL
jgi:hypothetical protein